MYTGSGCARAAPAGTLPVPYSFASSSASDSVSICAHDSPAARARHAVLSTTPVLTPTLRDVSRTLSPCDQRSRRISLVFLIDSRSFAMHRASWPTAVAVATPYVTVSDSIRDLAVHDADLGVHGRDLPVHDTDLGVHDGPIWVSTMLRSRCPRWADARIESA